MWLAFGRLPWEMLGAWSFGFWGCKKLRWREKMIGECVGEYAILSDLVGTLRIHSEKI
jgi:hypothetical protein